MSRTALAFIATALLVLGNGALWAASPRVLPDGKRPNDWRLGPLKDLNGYFPFQPAKTQGAWSDRAEKVRLQVKVALGVWPEPTRTPLNATVHGKVDRGDYTVERVYFESVPGYYVTGSLYRPKDAKGKRPAVLCPHGHWADGRFYDAGEAAVERLIEKGAEKFAEGGRSPMQARCVTLARLGCVVFHYDMIGYADSQQVSFHLAHRFAKQRPAANDARAWGFYSPQAESRLQSLMGLQIWSGVRALDFLESLPDVDPKRLAVTGASGGGTQTMLLGAIDSRLAAIVPAVMVSTAMQGGCTCENCSLLRVGTGNVEFAALFAPKPQLLIAADDWTREMRTKGFPELLAHYSMLGAKDHVALNGPLEFKHNYNYVNRAAMYKWFNEHLQLGHKEPIVERDYKRLAKTEMTVWNHAHPKPDGGLEFEKRLTDWLAKDAQQQLAAAIPQDKADLDEFKRIVGRGIDAVIGRGLPDPKRIEYDQAYKNDHETFLEMAGMLTHTLPGGKREQLPILFLYPKDWNKQVVIWITDDGKGGVDYEDDTIAELMDEGTCVIGVDLLYQGEFLGKDEILSETRRVKNPREAAAYTFGYNRSLFARRVHDILTVVSYVENHGLMPEEIVVVGLDGSSGPLVAAARAQAGEAIDRAAINTDGFRFGEVDGLHSVDFLPGGAKYFDLPGMLAVAAPATTWLAGEDAETKPIAQSYRAADAEKNLTRFEGRTRGVRAQQRMLASVVLWILR